MTKAERVALDDADSRLSRFFLTQLGINVGFGCVIGTGLDPPPERPSARLPAASAAPSRRRRVA